MKFLKCLDVKGQKTTSKIYQHAESPEDWGPRVENTEPMGSRMDEQEMHDANLDRLEASKGDPDAEVAAFLDSMDSLVTSHEGDKHDFVNGMAGNVDALLAKAGLDGDARTDQVEGLTLVATSMKEDLDAANDAQAVLIEGRYVQLARTDARNLKDGALATNAQRQERAGGILATAEGRVTEAQEKINTEEGKVTEAQGEIDTLADDFGLGRKQGEAILGMSESDLRDKLQSSMAAEFGKDLSPAMAKTLDLSVAADNAYSQFKPMIDKANRAKEEAKRVRSEELQPAEGEVTEAKTEVSNAVTEAETINTNYDTTIANIEDGSYTNPDGLTLEVAAQERADEILYSDEQAIIDKAAEVAESTARDVVQEVMYGRLKGYHDAEQGRVEILAGLITDQKATLQNRTAEAKTAYTNSLINDAGLSNRVAESAADGSEADAITAMANDMLENTRPALLLGLAETGENRKQTATRLATNAFVNIKDSRDAYITAKNNETSDSRLVHLAAKKKEREATVTRIADVMQQYSA